MKRQLSHLCILIAAIILIAGGAVAASAHGLAGEGPGVAIEFYIVGENIARPTDGSVLVRDTAVTPDQDSQQHACRQDCSINCVPSAVSICGAAAIYLTSEFKALDRASVAAYGIVDAGLLAAGIDPEAIIRPPQTSPEAVVARFSDLFG